GRAGGRVRGRRREHPPEALARERRQIRREEVNPAKEQTEPCKQGRDRRYHRGFHCLTSGSSPALAPRPASIIATVRPPPQLRSSDTPFLSGGIGAVRDPRPEDVAAGGYRYHHAERAFPRPKSAPNASPNPPFAPIPAKPPPPAPGRGGQIERPAGIDDLHVETIPATVQSDGELGGGW